MDGEQEGAFKPRGIRSGRSAKRKREAHQRRQFILHPEHYSDPSQVPVVHQGGQQRPLYTLPTWEPHYTSDEEEVEVVQVISEPSSSSKAPALSGPVPKRLGPPEKASTPAQATSPKLPPPKAVIPVAVAPVPAFHRLAKVPPVPPPAPSKVPKVPAETAIPAPKTPPKPPPTKTGKGKESGKVKSKGKGSEPEVVNLPGDSAVVNPHTGVISHLDRTSASQIPKAFVLDFHNVLDRFFPGGRRRPVGISYPNKKPVLSLYFNRQ